MKKEVCSVLYYLATVKIIDMLSKGLIEPQLARVGLSKRTRKCITLGLDVSIILVILLVLKGRDV
jgi:hypothetical protein